MSNRVSLFSNIERDPDFVNEKGNKWWFQSEITKYAQSKGLEGISAWIVKFTDSTLTYILLRENNVIFESTSLEGIGLRIDLLATLKK